MERGMGKGPVGILLRLQRLTYGSGGEGGIRTGMRTVPSSDAPSEGRSCDGSAPSFRTAGEQSPRIFHGSRRHLRAMFRFHLPGSAGGKTHKVLKSRGM